MNSLRDSGDVASSGLAPRIHDVRLSDQDSDGTLLVTASGANESTRIVIGGIPLATAMRNPALLAARIPQDLLDVGGSFAVVLRSEDGESEFQPLFIAARHAKTAFQRREGGIAVSIVMTSIRDTADLKRRAAILAEDQRFEDYEILAPVPEGTDASGDDGFLRPVRVLKMHPSESALRCAVDHAEGSYLLLLADGESLRPRGLEALTEYLDEHPGVAFVHGMIAKAPATVATHQDRVSAIVSALHARGVLYRMSDVSRHIRSLPADDVDAEIVLRSRLARDCKFAWVEEETIESALSARYDAIDVVPAVLRAVRPDRRQMRDIGARFIDVLVDATELANVTGDWRRFLRGARCLLALAPAELIRILMPRMSNRATFHVLAKDQTPPQPSKRLSPPRSLALTALHPPFARVGEPFHVQDDDSSAVAIECQGATEGVRILFDGHILQTTVASPTLVTATVPRHLLELPRSIEIRLWEPRSTSAGHRNRKSARLADLQETGVAVVIPCFNQAAFLADAIESVLRQTLPPDEIVVVDDGSSDETKEVASRYSEVRVLSQQNLGLSAARNTGIRVSSAPLLVFLDADDRLLPEAIEHGVSAFRENPRVAFVYGGYHRIDVRGRRLVDVDQPGNEPDPYAALLLRNYIVMHGAMMIRRDVLDAVGMYDETLKAAEDYELYFRVARRYPIHGHGRFVAEVRKHPGTMTTSARRMLKATLAVNRRERRLAARDPRLWSAYKRGIEFRRSSYGERLVLETHFQLRTMRLRDALLSLWTLFLEYRPGFQAVIRGLRRSNTLLFRVLEPGNGMPPPESSMPDTGENLHLVRLHPVATEVGRAFNVQPDGRSALAIDCLNALPSTVVVMNGIPLETAFGDSSWLSAVVPDEIVAVAGEYEVYLLR